MAGRPKKKLKPRSLKAAEVMLSVRLPLETMKRAHIARGELPASVWVRNLIDDAVMTPADLAVREVEALMARRGVTVDMLKK